MQYRGPQAASRAKLSHHAAHVVDDGDAEHAYEAGMLSQCVQHRRLVDEVDEHLLKNAVVF